jgi:hypothetical protein
MKSSDIIQQLLSVLPSQTALFSDEVSISTLSKVGTTVTAVTSAAHGLATGDYVYVNGAQRLTAITSITRVGTGATQSDYNGTKTLLNVTSRTKFDFTVTGSPTTPATGTIYLKEPWRRGFNGWYQVTVTDSTTFTYTSLDTFTATATGTMVIRKLPRISGALNLERAVDSYTKFGQNKLWAFVVLGPVKATRDRFALGDSIASHMTGSTFRQSLINEVEVYVFTPTKTTISGRVERDVISDVARYLYKSLVGITYPTYFVDEPSTTLNFLEHKFLSWNNGFYIHQFRFEGTEELTKNDVVEPTYTRAFRDLQINLNNKDFGNTIMTTLVNMDEVKD